MGTQPRYRFFPHEKCGQIVLKQDLNSRGFIVPGKYYKEENGDLVVWCRTCKAYAVYQKPQFNK